jgi:peptidoglycan hydrolase-like protein with peptidoglycan-binding domain
MKRVFLLLTMFCLAAAARADDQTQAVQQALKDQGFYYGTVDGQGGAETDAAIRRYQIRQGLEVTGKLDAETLAALNLGGGVKGGDTIEAAPSPAEASTEGQPAGQESPAPKVVESDHDFLRSQSEAATPAPSPEEEARPVPEEEATPVPVERAAPVEPQEPPDAGPTLPAQYAFFFRKTPYETAPPVVQQNTVQAAQRRLGREGFYRGIADGELSDSLSRALAGYQRDEGLRVTGRLDMATLADMNLLPQQHVIIRPAAPLPPPPYQEPFYGEPRGVYRGIWVH